MRAIELGGPIRDKMWSYDPPYPTPRIEDIPAPDWLDYPIYSQTLTMSVQTGTYLETAAHIDRNAITIDQVAPERCILLECVRLLIPRAANQGITASDLSAALHAEHEALHEGEGLLVGTGWDKRWNEDDFVTDPPYFTADGMDWILDHKVSLLGADTPRFDNPRTPANHLLPFFRRGTLLLAPIVNLHLTNRARGRLMAQPLRIHGAVASPVNPIWLEDEA